MPIQNPEKTRFNKRLDELVENVISHNLFTPEFRTEYVKAMNLYRRVAECDTQLALEILESTLCTATRFRWLAQNNLVNLELVFRENKALKDEKLAKSIAYSYESRNKK